MQFGVRFVFSGEDTDGVSNGLVTDIWLGTSWFAADGISIGADLGYVSRGEKKRDRQALTDTGSTMWHLLPWVAYRVPDAGTATLALAYMGEDATTGWAISHTGAASSSLPPLTLRWSMSF